jgi:tRNA modification GTPase
VLRSFTDAAGAPIDEGLALYFPAPRSYTGEDVLELQGHGSPVLLDRLLARALELGARTARPGEFTERAYLNGRMDLAQAEAVADLIEAASTAAARTALQTLRGAFGEAIATLQQDLTALRVRIEAGLDFPDEDIEHSEAGIIAAGLAALQSQLADLRARARQGSLLREGLRVVIVGRPNVGKSSLLNRLAGREAAIVSRHPGTTRDVLRETLVLDGLPLHLIDTAGLREGADDVEREGVRRARRELEHADLALILSDASRGQDPDLALLEAELPASLPRLHVRNKIDLTDLAPGRHDDGCRVSALSGAGCDALVTALTREQGYQPQDEGVFTARRRHLEALDAAGRHIALGAREFAASGAAELAAEELRLAQQALGSITGEFVADDLLGEIFSSFCIGK